MQQLEIKNFKCFQQNTVLLNDLTLLVGANGMGKSSVIQALLLLQASPQYTEDGKLPLNGIYDMALGTSSSVLNQNALSDEIEVALVRENSARKLTLAVNPAEEQLWLDIVGLEETEDSTSDKLYYLDAERIGPRISQKIVNLSYSHVGVHGEYTAQVISANAGRNKVREERMFPGSVSPLLPDQVNQWIHFVLPDTHVTASTDLNALQAQIRVSNKLSGNMFPVLAPNIGFGISYVLPIIVEGLNAEVGSTMIVENPEAHLHPAAQTAIGEFLAMISHSGIRVVMETHSEHVVNGVQLYVAEHPEFSPQVIINNFSTDESGHVHVEDIQVSEVGEITRWPKGFMDQAQIDFIRLRRGHGKS